MKKKTGRVATGSRGKKGVRGKARTTRPPKAERRAKKSQASPPMPPKNAEIISRQGFLIDATGKGPHAVPEVVLLANKEALTYLAQLFSYLANSEHSSGEQVEAATVGLPRNDHPINTRLSDDLEFRFALLTDDNRRQMFKKFGIDMASRQKGSLFERYQEVVSHFGRLQNLMKREGLST